MPIPIAFSEGRFAMSRMYIDFTLAIHTSIYPPGKVPKDPDCHLTMLAAAVMEGHAEGRPRTASQLAKRVNMPNTSVLKRLNRLIAHGLIVRIGRKYYLEPERARLVPHRDRFELVLSQGFDILGPLLSKLDK